MPNPFVIIYYNHICLNQTKSTVLWFLCYDCNNKDISHWLYINSTVRPTCVLFMCIVVMIMFTTTKPIAIPCPVVWGIQASITFLSMIVTFVIWFLVKRNTRKFLIEKQWMDVAFNIKFVFFWTFSFANIYNFALHMATDIDCLLKGERQPYLIAYHLSIVTHLIEICFCVWQLGFLIFYGQFCFRSSSLINYGIYLMIITHLSRWFNSFFDPNVSARNWIPSNVVQLENCLRASNITTIRKDLETYINPLLTEYSLLSVAIAVRMFVNICNDNSGSTFSDIQDASIDSEIATSNEIVNLPQTPTMNISTFASCTSGLVLSLPFLVAFICSFLGTVDSAEVYRIICTIFDYSD